MREKWIMCANGSGFYYNTGREVTQFFSDFQEGPVTRVAKGGPGMNFFKLQFQCKKSFLSQLGPLLMRYPECVA